MLLVTGAAGYVGQHLLKSLGDLSPADAQQIGCVLPTWRNRAMKQQGVQIDLADQEAVSALFAAHEIAAIIHLAAEARTVECQRNPELARRGNVEATRNLLQAAESSIQARPWFLYMSTDMVFRGDAAPYSEDDPRDATSAYGKSKADAEALVANYKGPWCIVRPALIYGSAIGDRVSCLAGTLAGIQTGNGRFFTDEIRTPVYVKDLTSFVLHLLCSGQTGIYHAGGPDQVSRFKFAQLLAKQWKLNPGDVHAGRLADSPEHAWRPRDISLQSHAAHSMLPFTPLTSALAEIYETDHNRYAAQLA